jgi:hypothetical protein
VYSLEFTTEIAHDGNGSGGVEIGQIGTDDKVDEKSASEKIPALDTNGASGSGYSSFLEGGKKRGGVWSGEDMEYG